MRKKSSVDRKAKSKQAVSKAQQNGKPAFYQQPWFIPALLIAVTFLVYLPNLSHDFVNWDDDIYVTDNLLVQNPNAENLKTLATEPNVANYHPITMLSLAFNYAWSGLDASSYHLVNLLFHLINCWLVYAWMLLISKQNRITAGFVAAVFALHPMHVESVAWIAERKDVLFTCFYLLGLITYTRYVQKGLPIKSLLLVLLWFALSLLSKPAAVVFPLHLLLVDYFLRRSFSLKQLLEKAPFLIGSAVIGFVTVQIQDAEGAVNFDAFSAWQRIQLAAYALMMYVVKFVAPVDLSSFYPYPSRPFPAIYQLAPVVCLALLAVLGWAVRKNRTVAFGLGFFLVGVLLILQIVTVGSAIIADRYTYVPYLGLAFILGVAVERLSTKQSTQKYYKPALFGLSAACLLMAFGSFQRIKVWENGEKLWSDVIAKFPEEHGAWGGRGLYYRQKKQFDLAIKDLNQAIALNPNEARFFSNRGNIFFDLGRDEEALVDYNRCIALDATDKEAFANRGAIYGRKQRFDEGINDLSYALQLDADFFNAYMNRAVVYGMMNQHELAKADYNACLNLDPSNDQIWNALAIAYQHLRDFQGSIRPFDEAIRLNPGFGLYYVNRGISRKYLGQTQLAKQDFQTAQQLGQQVEARFLEGL